MLQRSKHACRGRERSVVAVAGEDFVGAFARQNDRRVPPRLARQPIHRQQRLIAKWLVQRRGNLGQERYEAALVKTEMVMAAADRDGQLARVLAFVVLR